MGQSLRIGLCPSQHPPPAGWFVAGLVLRGAAWDNINHHLVDQSPLKVSDHHMPIMWIVPSTRVHHEQSLVREMDNTFNSGRYLCPLYYGYQAANRGPEAVSSEADMSLAALPLPGGRHPKRWVKRGACLVASSAGIHVLPKSQQRGENIVDDIITISLPLSPHSNGTASHIALGS